MCRRIMFEKQADHTHGTMDSRVCEHNTGQQPDDSLSGASSEEPRPRFWTTILIVGSLCISVFLIALDYTIVTTAIPRIT